MLSELVHLVFELADLITGDRAPSFSTNDHPEYQQVFESASEILAKDPSNIEAYFMRGYVYGCKGLYAEALSDFQEVISLQPEHAQAWLLSSEVLFHFGEHDQAKAARLKARELNPACEHTPIRLLGTRAVPSDETT
jgi:tetratricopeptide (TPR) repeat protein